MSRRLAFADWLHRNGYQERARWFRECCGDCQYMRDLRASFTRIEASTEYCIGVDPIWRPTQTLEKIRPDWWRLPPSDTGYQRCHFGRVIVGEFGDPSWLYDGSWLDQAWREGWLEILALTPHDEEQLMRIAQAPEHCQAVPFILDTTATWCHQAPEQPYRQILQFSGLHGLILGPKDIALNEMREFADKAPSLRFLQLLGMQKREVSIRTLQELPKLAHLRSLVIGTSHPDDESIDFVTSIPRLECLALYGKHLTDLSLQKIAKIQTLRYLAIDVPKVSRQAIEQLRQECPRLTIQVERDLRGHIGPA